MIPSCRNAFPLVVITCTSTPTSATRWSRCSPVGVSAGLCGSNSLPCIVLPCRRIDASALVRFRHRKEECIEHGAQPGQRLAARPVRRAPPKARGSGEPQVPPDRPSTPEGRQGCHPAPGPRDYSDHAGAPPRPGHRHEGEIGNVDRPQFTLIRRSCRRLPRLGEDHAGEEHRPPSHPRRATALFTTAGPAAQPQWTETARALERRVRHYTRPGSSMVDEVG